MKEARIVSKLVVVKENRNKMMKKMEKKPVSLKVLVKKKEKEEKN